MKQVNQNIRWSEQCGDPGCRVFFIGERVFRAYDESRQQETIEFLNSDCYTELLNKGMVVRTWIANDVSVDGYSLIVEHERMSFMPETWLPLEMLKDILAFHFEINALCEKYGYGLRDIGYGNVTLKNGQLCFTDFGSFRKRENIVEELFVQHCLPLAFAPIAIYSQNDGNDFLAHELLVNYSKWLASCTIPYKDNLLHERLRLYLHPIVSYYDVCRKQRRIHVHVKKRFCIRLITLLNYTMQTLFEKKSVDWRFIKISNVYSAENAAKMLKNIRGGDSKNYTIPEDTSNIVKELPTVLSRHIKSRCGRVVLWGNFAFDELKLLYESIEAEILVMSNDRVYANQMYSQLRDENIPIWVLCCNAMKGKDFDILKTLKADVLVVQDGIYEQAYESGHSDWGEKASYFASFLLVHSLNKEEMNKTMLYNYWMLKEDNNQYKLFENNAENIER